MQIYHCDRFVDFKLSDVGQFSSDAGQLPRTHMLVVWLRYTPSVSFRVHVPPQTPIQCMLSTVPGHFLIGLHKTKGKRVT